MSSPANSTTSSNNQGAFITHDEKKHTSFFGREWKLKAHGESYSLNKYNTVDGAALGSVIGASFGFITVVTAFSYRYNHFKPLWLTIKGTAGCGIIGAFYCAVVASVASYHFSKKHKL